MIPKVTGSQRRFNFIPEKETPAFAKAKIGKIIKFTHGAIECSKFCKGECDELSLEFSGINCANSTPAKLACIPDFTTSVKMNKLFRNIKENKNLDALEESDDEEEFEDTSEDKYVDLSKNILMIL